MHFTDDTPPLEVLENNYNWKHKRGSEGRSGCDETTISVQRRDDFVYEDTDYSVGDIWLPNEDTFLALMGVSGQQCTLLDIYFDDGVVRVQPIKGLWTPSEYMNPLKLELGDAVFFPMRYCSRLDHFRTKECIKGEIGLDGTHGEWVVENLWPE